MNKSSAEAWRWSRARCGTPLKKLRPLLRNSMILSPLLSWMRFRNSFPTVIQSICKDQPPADWIAQFQNGLANTRIIASTPSDRPIIDVSEITDFDTGVIGTGPYMVKEHHDLVGFDMVKNPNYYEEVPYDAVQILFMGDASAKANALQAGQVDLVENITNVADLQKLQADPNYTVDIASVAFHELKPIARHRLVYDALTDWMPHRVHALSIRASLPAGDQDGGGPRHGQERSGQTPRGPER